MTRKQAQTAKPWIVPLTPPVVALFSELKQLAGESPWVLSSDESKAGCYTDKALSKAMLRLWAGQSAKGKRPLLGHPNLVNLPPATPHDLRRTCRTWLGKLGAQPHIAERCLNHRLGKLVATYDQHDYLDERRAALEKWAAFVERLVAPERSNVAFLPTVTATSK